MYGNNDDTQAGAGGGYGSDPNDNSAPARPNVDDLIPANFPDDATPAPSNDTPQDQNSPTPDEPAPSTEEPTSVSDTKIGGTTDDLVTLKQKALQELSPLVDQLEQTPEERFRTTMMMIQASDNQDLIKSAYEAAEQISDKKEKAQALLDIVNEINYFTQQSGGPADEQQ